MTARRVLRGFAVLSAFALAALAGCRGARPVEAAAPAGTAEVEDALYDLEEI